jgi:hypothetical protein
MSAAPFSHPVKPEAQSSKLRSREKNTVMRSLVSDRPSPDVGGGIFMDLA